MISISSEFEGGSIEIVDAADPSHIRLRLRADPETGEKYWFYFRVMGARGKSCRFNFENAVDAFRLPERLETDVPGPWEMYRAFASYDLINWVRVPTALEEDGLVIQLTPEHDSVFLASFAPYTHERHRQLVSKAAMADFVEARVVGTSTGGNDIDLLQVGKNRPGRRVCWVTARQHPSEPMASWFTEGLIERLLDPDDFLSRKLLRDAVFYIVPCMNPDGVRRGMTRRNGAGVDLNRAWLEPSPTTSPEVFCVRNLMHDTGVDFYLDVHGDEELPYVFLGGPLEVPSLTRSMRANFRAYERAMMQANPDYRMGYPYPGGPPETANLQMAWNYVGETFQCLSILVEQPFKDCVHAPDPEKGFSLERCRKLGASALDALNAVIGRLE